MFETKGQRIWSTVQPQSSINYGVDRVSLATTWELVCKDLTRMLKSQTEKTKRAEFGNTVTPQHMWEIASKTPMDTNPIPMCLI